MLRTFGVLKAVSLTVPLCLFGTSAAVGAADLVDTMRADGRFGQLIRAIEAAELAETLRGPDAFTVFAPTDEAFAGRPSGELRDLLAGDRERLRTLLRHHVVEGRRPSNDLPPELPSLAGEPLAAEFGDGTLTVEDGDQQVTVVAGDIEADNGLIHAVDGVLVPSTLTQAPPEVAAQPQQEGDTEEGAATPAAGPEVAVGQPGQETGVEVASGQDGPRQIEARVTTEQPAQQPEATVTVTPPPSEPAPPAAPAEAAEPGREAEPQQQAQRPQVDAPEAQQPVVAQQPRPEQEQEQQQAMAPQPERAEPQQSRQQEQQPGQQARLTEEEPAPAEAREAPPAAALTSLETLSDRTVRSSDGEVEGRVTDLIFSRETGEIELVVVEYGGFLGLGRKSVAVPWQEVRFDNEAEQLIIDMSRAELQEAPAFDYGALDTERYAQSRR